ncbi:MAG: chloride channel protein [Gemmatimonadaceae bacterium]
MPEDANERPDRLSSTARDAGALPVAPSLAPALAVAESGSGTRLSTPSEGAPVDKRTIFISALAIAVAIGAGLIAQLLLHLIALATNISFFGRISTAFVSPGVSPHSPLVLLLVPVVGGVIVGIMARYGSSAIRGHGIPEVMERVLLGESRIPLRVMFLKPLSAAVAIGTGGPFGAEGPIIATGGALGSVVGQIIRITADERKTLLAAGAAAGMAATFGSPVSAVLLAVELLLFEYRPRSLIPVALAGATAAAVRVIFDGNAPVFAIPGFAAPSDIAMVFYTLLGGVIGLVAAGITKISYGIEDVFERLGHRFHIHWMWFPAIGAVVVGVVGLIEPRTLGVGYDNITGALAGTIVGRALIMLVILKFISWSIYLGSGTSGGTLAPLFTIGGGLGAWFGAIVAAVLPTLGVDPRVAGLVGMAAMFAGASHALLASIIFAFETTRQPLGLLPLLAGCSAAYLVSLLLSRHSIMTEKLARRGMRVQFEYAADHLAQVLVRDVASSEVVLIDGDDTIAEVREWFSTHDEGTTHQGFPVVDAEERLLGVVTRRDLLNPALDGATLVRDTIRRRPAVIYEDSTLRETADHMVVEQVGRLPVVRREDPLKVVGIISRSDLIAAHAPRLRAARRRASGRFTWIGRRATARR